jgi:hypothetical protein
VTPPPRPAIFKRIPSDATVVVKLRGGGSGREIPLSISVDEKDSAGAYDARVCDKEVAEESGGGGYEVGGYEGEYEEGYEGDGYEEGGYAEESSLVVEGNSVVEG